jgi:hypothetical protein
MKPRHPRRATEEKKGVPKLSEVIPELVRLDEERSNYVWNELPKLYADWPLVGPGEDPEPPIPQEAQILELLEKLPEEMVYQLIVITRLSRRYHSTEDLAELYHQIKVDFDKPDLARSFLAGMGSLGHKLTEGMAKLEANQLDVDKLDEHPRKPARARK